jgi:hypothetical protein
MCNLRLIVKLTRHPNIIDIISDNRPTLRWPIYRILYKCQAAIFLVIHLLTDCITLFQTSSLIVTAKLLPL